jgi:Flp pilus assembly protein TadD
LSAFQKALQIEPDSAKVYVGSAFAYLNLKQFQNALRQFDHARKLDPNAQYALAGVGSTYAQLKDYANAEVALRGAVAVDPNNPAALFNLGMVCLARKNRDCALSQYNRLKMTDSPLAKTLFTSLSEGRVVYVSDARK